MDWSVRQATKDDAATLALVGAATFLETFAGVLDGTAFVAHCQKEHSSAAYQAHHRSGGTAWLAEARQGGAPIGFAFRCNLATGEQPGPRRP